jgi:hypothetical protein
VFSSTSGSPRHRADEGAARTVSRALRATLVGAAAISLGLIGTGTSYAFLNASASASTGGVLRAGTATLAVSAAETVSFDNLYPGETRRAAFTVSNTGDVALALAVDSVSGATASNGLVAGVAAGACSATSAQTTTGPLGVTVPKAGSTLVCFTVSMPVSAPATAIRTAGAPGTTLVVSITGSQQS